MAATTRNYLPSRPHTSYTVAWLCALIDTEYAAAVRMLGNWQKGSVLPNDGDDNSYRFVDLNGHNAIVACIRMNRPPLHTAHGK